MAEKKEASSSADKVLTLLEHISDFPDGISLAALTRATGMAKTTAFRILERLRERQYVIQDGDTERYLLGLKSLELGMKGLMNANLVEVAIPYLKKLSAKTGETCFLGVYSGGHVVYLYKSEGTLSIQTNARLGARFPAYCTGIGKALLAYQPLAEIDAVLSQPLRAVTDKTLVDRVALYEALADIRLRGYSRDDEENEEGLTCIARPVFNYTDEIVGAISVAGPTHRVVPKIDEINRELEKVCTIISQRLGHISHEKPLLTTRR
ncbi:transcriptional regulator [Pluralibacter gergoviae]|uniref:IclR family transcriptional regulator n=1 Tax=Pluralibacter gergoviae TaxID=61647 RepID=UPI0005ECE28C|nr:IclR family transcriptional regulator [Pluralibacter gergoviae]KJM59650.1 transcriptional regulator [Pluralibacter gergoviae]OUR04035.1 transcriptional regulator [Pluralibacter gergoviae]